MKIKKVLLINCSLDKFSREKIRAAVSSPNLGLLSIAGILLMHGYRVKIIDFFVEEISKEEYVNILNEYNPDVIGYSVYTRTVPFLKRMVAINKKVMSNAINVVGGPHPTFRVNEMLNEIGADFVIRGEGEFVFLKLLESLNYPEGYRLKDVKGISYLYNKQIVNTASQGYIKKLDALPLQPIGLIKTELYSTAFSIITSRGCPGNCIYCASRALAGNEYRMRSAENVISEIYFLEKKLNSTKIIILDDTFTADKERLKKFCQLVYSMNDRYTFRIESRVDSVVPGDIDMLKKIGCEVIHFGVESGSQKVIKQIGKNIDLCWAEEIMEYACKQKIHVVASFIIGHYCDTKESVLETINLLKRLKNRGIEVSVAGCIPFPGTPLYNNKKKLGVEVHANSWQEYDFSNIIVSTDYLNCEQLRELLFLAVQESM